MPRFTPAVFIDSSTSKIFEREIYNRVTGANVLHTTQLVRSVRTRESRPQSVHSTPVNSDRKYVKPLAWQHSGGKQGASTLVRLISGNLVEVRSEEGEYWIADPITTASLNGAIGTAVQRALAKLGEPLTNMAVMLREAEDVLNTARLYGQAVQKGLHGLIDLCENSWSARRDMRNFIRHGWKEVPSFYLGYIFGIAPLGDDLVNAVSVLSDLVDSDGEFSCVVKGKSKVVDEYKVQLKPVVGDIRYWGTVRRTIHARATLRFVLPASKLRALEFITPFSQAYETTRLSFVGDYIYPIGPWLSALEGCQIAPFFRDGTTSTKTVDEPVNPGYITGYGTKFVSNQTVTLTGQYEQYQRNVLNSFPWAAVFSPPTLRLPTLQQVGVLGALIGQSLSTLARTIKKR